MITMKNILEGMIECKTGRCKKITSITQEEKNQYYVEVENAANYEFYRIIVEPSYNEYYVMRHV